MFTRAEYLALSKADKAVVAAVAVCLHGDDGADTLNKRTDEELTETFELVGPCEGCVPEGYEENLHENIIRKFYAVYGAAKNLAVKRLKREKRWTAAKWATLDCIVQPSTEDRTYVVVYDDNIVYATAGCKSWNFQFNTFEALVAAVDDAADIVYSRYPRVN